MTEDFRVGIIIALSFMMLFASGAKVNAAPALLPHVEKAMLDDDYWINKIEQPNALILDPAHIAEFNRRLQESVPSILCDLTSFPESLDRAALARLLSGSPMPRNEERYVDGEKVADGAYYDRLALQLNLAGVGDKNPVRYGYTVRRSDLRTFPTTDLSTEYVDDDEFDLFQETAVNIAEPLLVLHQSTDGNWFFVQIYNYRGWVMAANIALSPSKADWLSYYYGGRPFLVVTGSMVLPRDARTNGEVRDWRAGMGTRFPIVREESGRYVVLLPQRNANGTISLREAAIDRKADVANGYLPYTRANVIRQAFKMLDEPYGWGGLHENRDCSSFVMDVFSSFGLRLPRNADQQERAAGLTEKLSTWPERWQRYREIEKLGSGAALYMRNHTLIYIGKQGQRYYAIHAFGSYGDASRPNGDGTLPRVSVMRVVVSDLALQLKSGSQLVEAMRTAKYWQ